MESIKASAPRAASANRPHERRDSVGYLDGKVTEAPVRARTMVVFSVDKGVVELAAAAAPATWVIENCRDLHEAGALLMRSAVRLVILDDEAINESMRGWLLDRIHRYAPHALVMYIAASHHPDNERRARAWRVQYYTAKPLDTNRTLRVLSSFVNASV
jgi:hypothetical protein